MARTQGVLVGVASALVGCGFRGPATAFGDAPGAIDVPGVIDVPGAIDVPGVIDGPGSLDGPVMVDAMLADATMTDAQGDCGGKVWFADFSTDPTSQDLNGDGQKDWAMRVGAFPMNQISLGIWHIPSAGLQPLDSQPGQGFTTRTIIRGRMKGAASNGAKGAVVYINIGFQNAGGGKVTYAPCFVDAKLEVNNTQTLNLWTVNTTGTDTLLTSRPSLPNDFVDFVLDLDPATLGATLTGGGSTGTYTLIRQPATFSMPSWVSVLGYSTAADIDQVRVEVCP